MRYAQIRGMDISNGEGIGIALFVQGCHFHCKGCFQPETWSFDGGEKWTENVEQDFIQLANKPYITRISILGGEPLCDENVREVYQLIHKFKMTYPNKDIWLYTGYVIEDILRANMFSLTTEAFLSFYRYLCIQEVDYLIDGQFDLSQRDLRLKFRGSANQRIWTKEDIEKEMERI